MTPILFATKDNAEGQLNATISPSATAIPMQTGNGTKFPQPYNGTANSGGSTTELNCTGILALIGAGAVGKPIRNVTDNSLAFIKSITTNQVVTTPLLGGSDNTWQNSDEWQIDECVLTLAKLNGNGEITQYEETLVKARSGDNWTARTRGYNGTTAAQFDSGDRVYLFVTSPIQERLKDYLNELAKRLEEEGDAIDTLEADLASQDSGKGASKVGIEDAGTRFTGTDVEAALAETFDLAESALNAASPTGAMVAWPVKVAPPGWLLCNGQAVLRSTYAALFAAICPTIGTFTVTINTPATFTKVGHGLEEGDAVYFTTTGALPTGLTANTIYYVVSGGLAADNFRVSSTFGGSEINTSGSQSGTHTVVLCPHGLGNGSTTFNVPDVRGRVLMGNDVMGSTAASRVTQAKAVGATGGSNNGAHTHTMTTGGVSSGGGATAVTNGTTANTNVLPPYVTENFIIKT